VSVRIIQVGLGRWGRDWAVNVLPIAEGIEVTAVVDSDPAALEAADRAGLLDDLEVYSSLEDSLEHADANSVFVTAAIAAHGPLILQSLTADRHVLVEKPLTPTFAEARQAVKVAEERDLVLAVVQNFRYYAPVLLASEIVRTGKVGQVRGASIEFRRFYPYDDTESSAPEIDHSIIIQIAIHHFDLMRAVLGEDAVSIYCHAWHPEPSTSIAPAAASAIVEFRGGAVVNYRASMIATGVETPWCGRWRIECADGDIVWAGPDYPMIDGRWRYDLRDPGYVEVELKGRPAEHQPLTAMLLDRLLVVEAFADAIHTGVDLPISGRNNLGSIAMMEGAIQSISTGTCVDLRKMTATVDAVEAVG
jgi:predicted dehydrogenase